MPLPDRTRLPRAGLTAAERIHRLIEWLRSGQPLTTPLAATTLGVSRRTITRDLTYLRESLNLDVQFEPSQNSYVLAEEHTALPFLPFPSLAPVLLNAHFKNVPAQSEAEGTPISVRFSASAVRAYLARGGDIPEGTSNEDGTLDVSFCPQNADEFMSYVLSRGQHIEVIAPPDFRRRVHMEIKRMLAFYEDEGAPGA